jgi:hypothetical protein|tara:strand:+ start:790 stop:993 length:204 start_codon:yes stop_codon:yes gene_type:complete
MQTSKIKVGDLVLLKNGEHAMILEEHRGPPSLGVFYTILVNSQKKEIPGFEIKQVLIQAQDEESEDK